MRNAPAIKVKNLSKFYRLGAKQERYKSLREAITNFGKRVLLSQAPIPSPETIWALQDVSFEVKKGEVVGIIGRNGAGKSTLLKILSRITEPTEGSAEICGRVSSLLEVGTGFHPELTGRENIYLNAAILGMKRMEIEHKFDEIIAFAEIEKFLDTPVKHYSSGMYARLAFAVAAHLDPDILLIDEVLAVGDAAFQKKCLGKMNEVSKQGRTVLFVSHNMGAVKRLCPNTLWLDEGKVKIFGPTRETVPQYITNTSGVGKGEYFWIEGFANKGTTEFKIYSIRILNDNDAVTSNIGSDESFSVEIQYRINKSLPYCRTGFLIGTLDGITIFEAYDSDEQEYVGRREPGNYKIRCKVPAHLLSPGCYLISINAGIPNVKNLVFVESIVEIEIEEMSPTGPILALKREGVIRPKLKWECEMTNDEKTTLSFS